MNGLEAFVGNKTKLEDILMNDSRLFVVFKLDDQRYGLPLEAVEKVYRAAQITLLPEAPEVVTGVINVQGRVVAVINLRKRFHLPEKEPDLDTMFMVANTARRQVILVADNVLGVFPIPRQEEVAAEKIFIGVKYVEGVVRLNDDLVIINDLDLLLSSEEENMLYRAEKKEGFAKRT